MLAARVGERSKRRLRRDLGRMSADGAAFSLMVGAGETWLPAFALALGLGERFAGLLSVAPLLTGAALGLVSARAVRRLGSHRRFVVACAALQAGAFAPLVAGAWVGWLPRWALLAAAGLYWAGGLGTGPAWNTWAGTIVPPRLRARYFARRTRLVQLAVLVGLVGGGWILHAGGGAVGDRPTAAFAVLFALAGLARAASVRLLAGTSEPVPLPAAFRVVPARELLARLVAASEGRFLLYLLVVQLAVQVAGPFFTPWLLERRGLSYGAFAAVTATVFVAKIAAAPALGEVARRLGPRALLAGGGLGIVPLPLLWLSADSLPAFVAVQAYAGLVWGAHELATMLLVFESIRAEERTSVLAAFNLAHATAAVAGALLGGLVLTAVGVGPEAYAAVFVASAVLRAASLLFLRGAAAPAPLPVPEPLPARVLAVRANEGAVDRPVLPALPDPPEPAAAPAPTVRTPTGGAVEAS